MTENLKTTPHSGPLVALPATRASRLTFLAPEATPARLIPAVAANHLDWFTVGAFAANGEICRQEDVKWLFAPGPDGEAMLPFPRMESAKTDATLDAILADCRRRKPGRIACWSLEPTQPRDLGARLAARGFEWGWKPHWMALDLHKMRADFPLPEGLRIAVDDESDWEVEELPYYNRDAKWKALLDYELRTGRRRTWHFGAWLEGKLVGHSLLHLTTGGLGVAGLYSVGVIPSARKQGVGRAVTLAACQFAQALGCHYATLNSATHIYDRIGFVSLGWGQTWWMHAPTLAAPPPTAAQIAFAEAIGRGNLKALKALDGQIPPVDLDTPLPCGLTPIGLAVKTHKPAAVEWLIREGATLDILHAWDLGWKERAARLLALSPELANRRSGPWLLTPLHEAAARGDTELARLLLTAKPDLEIRDTQFNGTPLSWARQFERSEMIALFENHLSSRTV